MAASLPPLMRRGKVRDIYDVGDRLLLVATDRISAFDWVLPTTIPDKGRVLTQLSSFWFDLLGVNHHQIAVLEGTDSIHEPEFDGAPWKAVNIPADVAADLTADHAKAWLAGRTALVRKCQVAPVECVVRGYLVGSGWKDYQRTGRVCGIQLPAGLALCDQLPKPIFTPATKAETGHDENINFEQMEQLVGPETADLLRRKSIDCYRRGAEHARTKGLLIADTKFEWGHREGEWVLIDEALTPDSSRFWPADDYQPGRNQVSFDKQFVREYLENSTWDKLSPPPPLPQDVVDRTREKYIEAYVRLTGKEFRWR